MKKHILFLALLLFTTTLITSCTNDNDLPSDNSSLGVIACNRAVIGVNQKVLLACKVAISPHATNAKIQWETSGGLTLEQDSCTDGISYRTFTFTTPGEHTVKCKATYIYGSEFVVAEKSFEAKVYYTDFLNSFRGDDIEMVKIDNPGIDEFGERLTVSETLYHQFMYDNDKLVVGHTVETKINTGNPSPKAAYTFFMLEVKKHEKRATTPIRYAVSMTNPSGTPQSFTPTPDEEALFQKFESGELLSDAERVQIGELVQSGTIKLAAMITVVGFDNKKYGIMVQCSKTDRINAYQLITSFGLRMA